jgi:predicted TIM-barrel fold metal-dependent hydrolase
MIIDIHRHLVANEWQSDRFWNGYATMVQALASKGGKRLSVESIRDKVFPQYFDVDGERHLEQMARAGIDRSAVFLFDTGLVAGEPAVSIEAQNLALFGAARRHPDKLIPFVHIDPRRPGAVDFVKRAVEELGAKGLKLHPGAGFNPEDAQTLAVIESIADHEIPVITHTGPSVAPTSSRYCDPIFLDRTLLRFPEVNVIAAHLAYGYREQLCSLGWQRPNLYTDISVTQELAKRDYPRFARVIRDVVDAFGAERVLFGTDSPFTWGVMSEAHFVTAVRNLEFQAPEGVHFSKQEIDLILGGNAQRLLRL